MNAKFQENLFSSNEIKSNVCPPLFLQMICTCDIMSLFQCCDTAFPEQKEMYLISRAVWIDLWFKPWPAKLAAGVQIWLKA